jgi:hypothetical protein
MNERKENSPRESKREPYRIRLPGFILDEDIGLGDAIKRVTYTMGIRPGGDCGCEHRASVLNRWVIFSPRHLR